MDSREITMASQWGIETQDDLRRKIEELLALTNAAQRALTKEAITALRLPLTEYHKRPDSRRMSQVERDQFSRMVHVAFIQLPKLSASRTWENRLFEMESTLRLYRSRLMPGSADAGRER
jgi:hypothetical protein